VEWQAAAPPEPNASDVVTDFPMSCLPAAQKQRTRSGVSRFSKPNLLATQLM